MNASALHLLVAVAAAVALSGCTASGAAPATDVVFVIVNQSDSQQPLMYGAYDPEEPGRLPAPFAHGINGRVPANDALVDSGQIVTASLATWTWHATHGGDELTFDPEGCSGLWIIEVRIKVDGDLSRFAGASRCEGAAAS